MSTGQFFATRFCAFRFATFFHKITPQKTAGHIGVKYWNGMKLDVKIWNDTRQLSEQLLRERYSSRTKYRISSSKYQPGESIPGTHKEGLLFIVNGVCKFSTEKDTAIMGKNSFVNFPRGDYEITAIGEEELHFVSIWDLEKLADTYEHT